MIDKGIRVTVEDLETGDRAETVILPGNYSIVVAEPCRVAHEAHYRNGTTVLTLKGRSAHLISTIDVEPTAGGR